jgi:hypothetical protein
MSKLMPDVFLWKGDVVEGIWLGEQLCRSALKCRGDGEERDRMKE